MAFGYNQAIEDSEAHANPAARVGKFNKRSGPANKIDPLTREEIQVLLVKAKETMPAYYPYSYAHREPDCGEVN